MILSPMSEHIRQPDEKICELREIAEVPAEMPARFLIIKL